MSEEKQDQEAARQEDEDVEAHKRRSSMTSDAPQELGDDDDSDDVEAHRRRSS
jgi:hypothetical protein